MGRAFGARVSLGGMIASATLDLPMGATLACLFGVLLLVWTVLTRVHAGAGSDPSPGRL